MLKGKKNFQECLIYFNEKYRSRLKIVRVYRKNLFNNVEYIL